MVDIIEYDLDKDYKHFFWIPQNIYPNDGSYNETFYKSEGIFYNLPIFALLKDITKLMIKMVREVSHL
jgi:hypothetical protein